MHTLMVIGVGLVLLGLCVLLASVTGRSAASAALWFLPLWLAGAAANMWVGVTRAGYTYTDEFPIFLVVFAVPALLALAARYFLRA